MIGTQTRIFVCTEPVDLRRSFDGLALAARELLGEDPESGALLVFMNRRANRLKCLWWDRTGYALLYKRLHRATFRLPPSLSKGGRKVVVGAEELSKILEGVRLPPKKTRFRSAA